MSDGREPGECSRTPSPPNEMRKEDSRGEGETCTLWKNKSVIELVNLEEEEEDVEVISNEEDESGDLFVLDTEGTVEQGAATISSPSPLSTENRNIPVMATEKKEGVFDVTKILTNDATTVASPSDEKKESSFKISCFNCGGDHPLQQCDVPLNQRRIAANRATHYNNKRSAQERYTVAGGNVPNGTHNIRAGEISDALREALGIGSCDIPEWIYRMRLKGFIDGYPPGYLAEALDQSFDELLQFHTDDKSLETPRSSQEEEREQGPPNVYANKVIVYPGFNYYDRCLKDRERFRVPRFDEYVRYLQEYAKEMHARQLHDEHRERTGKRKRNRDELDDDCKRFKNDSNDIIVSVSDESNRSGLISLQSAEVILIEDDTECNVPLSPTHSTPSTSRSQSQDSDQILFGTPVVCRKEHDKKKPSLEKFRDGVVPFEAIEESTENRGFFRALMTKIRKEFKSVGMSGNKIRDC